MITVNIGFPKHSFSFPKFVITFQKICFLKNMFVNQLLYDEKYFLTDNKVT